MELGTLVASVVSSLSITAAGAWWLGGRFVEHRLSRDLERHKSSLQREREVEKADWQRGLERERAQWQKDLEAYRNLLQQDLERERRRSCRRRYVEKSKSTSETSQPSASIIWKRASGCIRP